MANQILSPARLREVLFYNPESGLFHWICDTRRLPAGSLAGTKKAKYCQIRVDKSIYLAHRLAWLYIYGVWPEGEVDHINGVTRDNRICNLRRCTRGENSQNLSISTKNTSGFIGVSFCLRRCLWRSVITIKRKNISIGYFLSKEDASFAYLEAKRRLHNFQPTPRID